MLLKAGASVEPVTRIGSYTPLHLAARGGSGGSGGGTPRGRCGPEPAHVEQ